MIPLLRLVFTSGAEPDRNKSGKAHPVGPLEFFPAFHSCGPEVSAFSSVLPGKHMLGYIHVLFWLMGLGREG